MTQELPTMTPERLRDIRSTIGKTQSEMAELLGATLGNYKRWETGRREINSSAAVLAELRLQLHVMEIVI